MYYYSSPAGATGSGALRAGLPLTPTVALRSLYEQLRSFEELTARGNRLDIFVHFAGAIRPPARNVSRPMGDPVFDAIADYASKVIARAGLLTSRTSTDERNRFDEYSRMSRQVFTAEHALAVDLVRTVPDLTLRQREVAARAALALAAYWCDRDSLTGLDKASSHRLLGDRPIDPIGAVLHQHALQALTHRPDNEATPLRDHEIIDLTANLTAAS